MTVHSVKHVIAGALRAANLTCEVHDDHFLVIARDEDWLIEVGRRGWIVLSKNDRIRYPAIEKEALLKAGVAAFFLSRGV